MKPGIYEVYHKQNKIVPECRFENNFESRLLGLIGKDSLHPNESLLLAPCGSIHTCFMHFPIDVIFLDRDFNIIHLVSELEPWTLFTWGNGAYAVLEMHIGSIERHSMKLGESLAFIKEGDPLPELEKETMVGAQQRK
jgi:uncharacterized membrane protein (UPF0127 family)